MLAHAVRPPVLQHEPNAFPSSHKIVSCSASRPYSQINRNHIAAVRWYSARTLEASKNGGGLMVDRRDFMKACRGLGFSATLFPGVLWAQAQGKATITKEMI